MALPAIIDWSRWQDDPRTAAFPDLTLAQARGVAGHLFKAGRGLEPDPAFARFVVAARQLGVPWGAYWWPEPCLSSAEEQAQFTWSTVTAAGIPDLPMDIDVEGHRGERPDAVAPLRPLTPAEQAQWLRGYLDELRRLSGRDRLILYTADWYWNPNVAPGGVSFADCDLRVADYLPGTPPAEAAQWEGWIGAAGPDIPVGWSTWSAWQFSATGNAAGPTYGAESADLDLNVVRPEIWARWIRSNEEDDVAAALPIVSAGATGEHVSILQALLNVRLAAAGRALIAEDGHWSTRPTAQTLGAVTWFQTSRGLVPDGNVGPRTWRALLGLA